MQIIASLFAPGLLLCLGQLHCVAMLSQMALLKCYIDDDDDDEQSKRKKLPPWPESQHLWLKKQGCEGHLALHCHHLHR